MRSYQRSHGAPRMHAVCFLHSDHVRVRCIILIAKLKMVLFAFGFFVFFFARRFFGTGAQCILQIFALEISKRKSNSRRFKGSVEMKQKYRRRG